MGKFFRLIFVMSGNEVMNAGRELCRTASTPEEKKTAAAFRRVFYGTVIIAVSIVAALLIVMFLNNPFLASGDRRNGTVQSDGSIRYVQNVNKYATAEELGLADFELKSGDRVIIFFDKDDNIKAAYPKDFYESYTENRVMIIVMTALLGLTVLLIYAFVICRVTPFGRPWYLYCREKKSLGQPKLSKAQNAVIYAVSVVAALAICAPQIVKISDEIRRLREINEFGAKIKAVRQAADKAGEITDKLTVASGNLGENSALEDAKSAAEKINEIKNNLKNTQSR